MKLILIICDEVDVSMVTRALEGAGAKTYTLIPKVLGRGESRSHANTSAFPGLNCALLVGVDELKAEQVHAALDEIQGTSPHQVLRAFAWSTEQWI